MTGKIGAVVEEIQPGQVRVRITQARLKGEKLRADKGINLPDSTLQISALTEADLEVLPFVAEQADVIQLSFANWASDVQTLLDQLARLQRKVSRRLC